MFLSWVRLFLIVGTVKACSLALRPAVVSEGSLGCNIAHLQALQLHGQKEKHDRRRSELIHKVPNGKMHLFGIWGCGTTSTPAFVIQNCLKLKK